MKATHLLLVLQNPFTIGYSNVNTLSYDLRNYFHFENDLTACDSADSIQTKELISRRKPLK